MAACRSAEIADAVAEALNAGFPGELLAVRRWVAVFPLERPTGKMRACAVARSRASSLESRGSDRQLHAIDVTFQQSIAGATEDERQADIDEKTELVERAADFLGRRKMTAGGRPHSPAGAVSIDPLCAVNDADEEMLFTSVVSVAYHEGRAVP